MQFRLRCEKNNSATMDYTFYTQNSKTRINNQNCFYFQLLHLSIIQTKFSITHYFNIIKLQPFYKDNCNY